MRVGLLVRVYVHVGSQCYTVGKGTCMRGCTCRWVLHLLSAAFWAGKEGRDGEVTLEEEDADAEEEARDPHWEVSSRLAACAGACW